MRYLLTSMRYDFVFNWREGRYAALIGRIIGLVYFKICTVTANAIFVSSGISCRTVPTTRRHGGLLTQTNHRRSFLAVILFDLVIS